MQDREHELHQRRGGRNRGVLVLLAAFVVLLFAVSVVKFPGNPTGAQSWSDMWHAWVNE